MTNEEETNMYREFEVFSKENKLSVCNLHTSNILKKMSLGKGRFHPAITLYEQKMKFDNNFKAI